MSQEEVVEKDEEGLLNRVSPAMLVALTVVVSVFALLAVVSFILMLNVSSDVARLDSHLQKMGKTLATIEQDIARLRPVEAPAAGAKEGTASAPKAPPPRPTHIDAADPGRDCVIRSGSKEQIGDCLK